MDEIQQKMTLRELQKIELDAEKTLIELNVCSETMKDFYRCIMKKKREIKKQLENVHSELGFQSEGLDGKPAPFKENAKIKRTEILSSTDGTKYVSEDGRFWAWSDGRTKQEQ